jgi:plasmid stabilization system protein ParE
VRIDYHPEAEAELVNATAYYATQADTLGTRFADEIEQAIKTIAAGPLVWPIIDDDVRRYLLRRFPYGIYYRVLPDRLRVLAFKHHRRHPEYWRGRH